MSSEGVEAYELTSGSNNGDKFVDFVRGSLIGLICENPAIYLREVCGKIYEVTGVRVSTSTVCKVIHRNGITRKKLTKVALQRSPDRRDQLRKFGYAIRGQPAVCTQLFTRGKRISAVVAMSSEGVEAYELTSGSTTVINL